jgi:L-alanine-DL-glutamate epimerase-like enolase superfamily enzyme
LIYTPHTWTNGIGFAVNLQLMIAAGFAHRKAMEYPFNPPSRIEEQRDGLLENSFYHNRGTLEAPVLPGLGFRISRCHLFFLERLAGAQMRIV